MRMRGHRILTLRRGLHRNLLLRALSTSPVPTSPSSLSSSPHYWTTDRVRNTFVDYFVTKHQHIHHPSSPLLPSVEDDTLLFVNSGMVQFKPMFEGRVPMSGHPLSGLRRATNSQKCIRAGGKHNDLDDVGKDNYHHTFFEMLGSWSFGDYFKEESIDQAWELLTQVYGLKPERLYATYFGGDDVLGIPPDLEARDLWYRYLPPSNVLPGNMNDNFWEMGEVGPCGPCSELHYDRIGGGRDASSLVNQDDPDVLEIWNLVFMQYVREKANNAAAKKTLTTTTSRPTTTLETLRERHIDTGMGLERLTSILQEKRSNYEIDTFRSIMNEIYRLRCLQQHPEDMSMIQIQPYQDGVGVTEDPHGIDAAYRVVADHARTLVFALSDRVVPGSIGRGYVLRRIFRRGVLYGERTLHLGDSFFSQLVPTIIAKYKDGYPELVQNEERIVQLLQIEEVLFRETWEAGKIDFEKMTEKMKEKNIVVVSGVDAARLHQERGFPIDLTRLLAEDIGMSVDEAGFLLAQEQHVLKSKGLLTKKYEKDEQQMSVVGMEGVTRQLLDKWKKENQGKTAEQQQQQQQQHLSSTTPSTTPQVLSGNASVLGISCCHRNEDDQSIIGHQLVHHNGLQMKELQEELQGSTTVAIALSSTNFYVESGGQVDDHGFLKLNDEYGCVSVKITNMMDVNGLLWHIGHLDTLSAAENMNVNVKKMSTIDNNLQQKDVNSLSCTWNIDQSRRDKINKNHTATHLLNAALRRIVVQGGDKCRTDDCDYMNDVDDVDCNDENNSCDQRGSLVNDHRLRFDFSLDRSLTYDEILNTEQVMNDWIHQNEEIYIEYISLDSAKKNIHGLRAVFGEAYPDPVRVVSIGTPVTDLIVHDRELHRQQPTLPSLSTRPPTRSSSVEFCGGTHVDQTSDIQLVIICEEKGISKGVRRVTCLTGDAALKSLKQSQLIEEEIEYIEDLLRDGHHHGGSSRDYGSNESSKPCEHMLRDLSTKIDQASASLSYIKKLDFRQRMDQCIKILTARAKVQEKEAEEVLLNTILACLQNNDRIIHYRVEHTSNNIMKSKRIRKLMTKAHKKMKKMKKMKDVDAVDSFLLLMDDGQCYAVCDKKSNVNADDWIHAVTVAGGGKGGGRQDFASATGITHIENAKESAASYFNLRTN
jgi:alanyl-tRNA synthetase